MLKKCDLTEQIDQKTFDKEMDPMRVRLGQLQRELHAGKIPVIIVIEGWNAAGISLTVKELVRAFDPRGIELSTIGPPADEETAPSAVVEILEPRSPQRRDRHL